jgi:aldehyde dehydrogenase (NAD+)
MIERLHFYIDGAWVAPVTPRTHEVINPATEEPIARISLGSAADVDKAVAAAKRAFETYSLTSRDERIALLEKIIALYQARLPEIAEAISSEMGAPMWLANAAQAPAGLGQLMGALNALKEYEFE